MLARILAMEGDLGNGRYVHIAHSVARNAREGNLCVRSEDARFDTLRVLGYDREGFL
jgi:hypothetical protein